MIKISRKTWGESGVEITVFKGNKWLHGKHIETQLGNANLPAVTNKYPSKYKKQPQELQNCGNYQACRRILKEEFPKHIIMDRNTTPAVLFRAKLGFKQNDPIMTQEQSVLSKIMTIFSAEKIELMLMLVFLTINYQLRSMNKDIKTDLLTMK